MVENKYRKPKYIYSVDKKGCRLTIHHQQNVYIKCSSRKVQLVVPKHGENITIVGCAHTLNQVISPVFLFKRQHYNEDWINDVPLRTSSERC
jgi:hypothetical protein